MELQIERGNIFLLLQFSVIILLYAVALTSVYDYFGIIIEAEIPTQWSPFAVFCTTSVLAPIIETWICQYLSYRLIFRFLKIKSMKQLAWTYILITSLLFSVMHSNSMWFMLYALLPGSIMSYCFLYFYNKSHNYSFAFWHTAALHAIVNTTIFIIESIFE